MLAIGRALMAKPRLLLLDEPSMGLAPIVVQEIFRSLRAINADGLTLFLVEQNVRQALKIAQHGYVLENGAMALSGTGRGLLGLSLIHISGGFRVSPWLAKGTMAAASAASSATAARRGNGKGFTGLSPASECLAETRRDTANGMDRLQQQGSPNFFLPGPIRRD